MMSPHNSCDLWELWQTVAVDLRLNYKAGTAEPELPYKAAIAFDDPRLAMARPQLPENLPKPYQSVPRHTLPCPLPNHHESQELGCPLGGQAAISPN